MNHTISTQAKTASSPATAVSLEREKYISIGILAALLVFSVASLAEAKTRMALLPIITTSNVSEAEISSVENFIQKELVGSRKYTLAERTMIDRIMKEQAFQISGVVSPEQTMEVGKLLSVEKFIRVILDRSTRSTLWQMSVDVIDVTTGAIETSESFTECPEKLVDAAKRIPNSIIRHYPLIGQVLSVTSSNYVIDLGSQDGLQIDSRLFVARDEAMLDDATGAVLFSERVRVGTLRVMKITGNRSVVTALQTLKPVAKNDLVSMDPIPHQEIKISKTPLVPEARKGKLLIEDAQDDKSVLSVQGGTEPGNEDGMTIFDATARSSGYAYGFYPSSRFNQADFWLESDIQFAHRKSSTPTSAFIVFRSNGYYESLSGYYLQIIRTGTFKIGVFSGGAPTILVKEEATSAMNRNSRACNQIRIVAKNNCFDIFLNDTFMVGFTDETIESGTFGYMCFYKGEFAVDKTTLWSLEP